MIIFLNIKVVKYFSKYFKSILIINNNFKIVRWANNGPFIVDALG
jgi:hypothetical protein